MNQSINQFGDWSPQKSKNGSPQVVLPLCLPFSLSPPLHQQASFGAAVEMTVNQPAVQPVVDGGLDSVSSSAASSSPALPSASTLYFPLFFPGRRAPLFAYLPFDCPCHGSWRIAPISIRAMPYHRQEKAPPLRRISVTAPIGSEKKAFACRLALG